MKSTFPAIERLTETLCVDIDANKAFKYIYIQTYIYYKFDIHKRK